MNTIPAIDKSFAQRYLGNPTVLLYILNTIITRCNELIVIQNIGTTNVSVLTATLAEGSTTTLDGSTFSNPIVSEPRFIAIFKDGVEVDAPKEYVANGDYYDVIITSDDEIVDAIISVIF